jgi:hypothetical protein
VESPHLVTLRLIVDEGRVAEVENGLKQHLSDLGTIRQVVCHKDDWRLEPLNAARENQPEHPTYITCQLEVSSADIDATVAKLRDVVRDMLKPLGRFCMSHPQAVVNPLAIPLLPTSPDGLVADTRQIVRRHPPYVR